MKRDGVSLAFEKILKGIEAVETQYKGEGATAFHQSRYEDAEELNAANKRLSRFRKKLQKLQLEWNSGIDLHVKKRVNVDPRQPVRSQAKQLHTNLKITLPSGRVIQRPTPAITMAETIEAMGIPKVGALGVTVCGAPLLSMEKHSNYGQTRVGKYFIYTQSNTKTKKNILETVASKLGYKLKVEII